MNSTLNLAVNARLLLCVALFLGLSSATWAAPILQGDFNGDGAVNLGDYTSWRDTDGSAADLENWKSNFGAGALALEVSANGVPASGPTASVVGVENGANIDWTVYFTPDETLFSDIPGDIPDKGLGGSLSVDFQFEVSEGTLVSGSLAVVPGFIDAFIGDTLPGVDPYSGSVEFGTQEHLSTTSSLGAGMVDALYAPLGGTFFTSGGPKAALTFSTTANGDTVLFGGTLFQGISTFPISTATATAIPEPTSLVLVMLGGISLATAVKRKR